MELYFERGFVMDEKNNVVEGIKFVGGMIISFGIGAIARNLIATTTPENVKWFGKFCIGIGSSFIALITAEAASTKFDGTVDSIVKFIQPLIDGNDEEQEELVVETEAS